MISEIEFEKKKHEKELVLMITQYFSKIFLDCTLVLHVIFSENLQAQIIKMWARENLEDVKLQPYIYYKKWLRAHFNKHETYTYSKISKAKLEILNIM
jgi:hypothetical protein